MGEITGIGVTPRVYSRKSGQSSRESRSLGGMVDGGDGVGRSSRVVPGLS